eukprot:gene12988-27412_t
MASSNNRSVDIGLDGFTPTRVYTFRSTDPVNQVPMKSSTRPKTSRAKSNPNPDEFADYIVQSPAYQQKGAAYTSDISNVTTENVTSGKIDIDLIHKEEMMTLACILFGAAFNL